MEASAFLSSELEELREANEQDRKELVQVKEQLQQAQEDIGRLGDWEIEGPE